MSSTRTYVQKFKIFNMSCAVTEFIRRLKSTLQNFDFPNKLSMRLLQNQISFWTSNIFSVLSIGSQVDQRQKINFRYTQKNTEDFQSLVRREAARIFVLMAFYFLFILTFLITTCRLADLQSTLCSYSL